MQVTLWGDIPKGKLGEAEYNNLPCTNYATHYYGESLICCRCHFDDGSEGLVSNERAREYHESLD